MKELIEKIEQELASKEKAIVSIFLILFMLAGLISVLLINKRFIEPCPERPQERPQVSMNPDLFLPIEEKVENEIRRQAKEYGVNEETAIKIAFCESRFNPNAENPNSSAVGVYQWLSGTWEYIGATKPRTDYKENIRQFMIHYPENPQWWSQCL